MARAGKPSPAPLRPAALPAPSSGWARRLASSLRLQELWRRKLTLEDRRGVSVGVHERACVYVSKGASECACDKSILSACATSVFGGLVAAPVRSEWDPAVSPRVTAGWPAGGQARRGGVRLLTQERSEVRDVPPPHLLSCSSFCFTTLFGKDNERGNEISLEVFSSLGFMKKQLTVSTQEEGDA